MTIISSKEFAANQQKYFDWAREKKEVCFGVREGDNIFTVSIANDRERKYLEPDDDFYQAITADELLKGIYEDIDKKYANRI